MYSEALLNRNMEIVKTLENANIPIDESIMLEAVFLEDVVPIDIVQHLIDTFPSLDLISVLLTADVVMMVNDMDHNDMVLSIINEIIRSNPNFDEDIVDNVLEFLDRFTSLTVVYYIFTKYKSQFLQRYHENPAPFIRAVGELIDYSRYRHVYFLIHMFDIQWEQLLNDERIQIILQNPYKLNKIRRLFKR